MNTIFITGGAGFIGSHLVKKLISKNYKVIIYDNLTRNAQKFTKNLENKNVKFIQGDILDSTHLSNSMKGAKSIIHLAAIAGVSNYYNFPAKTLQTNLIGTYNVLEAMKKNKISRIIEMSTSEVFGTEVIDVDENGYLRIGPPHEKRWSYAGSKIGGEQLIYRYSEEYKWNSTIVRPFNIYGPLQIGEGAIANFCKNAIENKNIKIEGTGSSMRSWCYIEDFIDALMYLITKPHKNIECFNIGNPWTSVSNLVLAEMILRQAKKYHKKDLKTKITNVPMSYTDIRVRYPNINKFQKFYNWTPKVNIEEGVERSFKWYWNYYESEK